MRLDPKIWLAAVLMILLGLAPTFFRSARTVSIENVTQEKAAEQAKIEPAPSKESPLSTVSEAPRSGSVPINEQRKRFLPEIVSEADRLHTPETSAEEDLEIVASLFAYYKRIHGVFPTGGENFELMKPLLGENSKNLAFINPEHRSLDELGTLRDRWGTPYYFHSLSKSELEIRSAGPDRQLWTTDDLILE